MAEDYVWMGTVSSCQIHIEGCLDGPFIELGSREHLGAYSGASLAKQIHRLPAV